MKSLKIICILFLIISSFNIAESRQLESYYEKYWCEDHNGTTEVILSDNTRCDCVTKKHAIEFEFAHKYAEAIGQSLHYGSLTHKKPGIVLIIENEDDFKFLSRLTHTINYYKLPITVWVIEVKE